MEFAPRYSEENTKELGKQIVQAINKLPDASHAEILSAMAMVMANIFEQNPCPDCRKRQAEGFLEMIAAVVRNLPTTGTSCAGQFTDGAGGLH